MKWLKTSAVRRLKFIASYSHTDVDSLHRVEFAGQERSAAESWLQRMCKKGYLQTAPLDRRRVYYRLTAKAVLYLKRHCNYRVSRASTRPLTPNRKFEKHALLQYCTAPKAPQRSAYQPNRDAVRFPDIAAHISAGKANPLRHKLFYLEGTLVGYLVADRGQRQLVQERIRPRMVSLFNWDSFKQLASENCVRLTVVTMSHTRSRELTQDIKSNPPPFSWEIVPIPELLGICPPTKLKADASGE